MRPFDGRNEHGGEWNSAGARRCARGRSEGERRGVDPRAELLDAGPDDNVYVLDPETGVVTFGDRVNGRKPPVGGGDISVSYRYGDGSSGNIAKRIDAESDLIGFCVVADAACHAVGWRKPRL